MARLLEVGLTNNTGALVDSAPSSKTQTHATKLREHVKTAVESDLARSLDLRVPDLIQYQNRAYADAYVRHVEAVRQIESTKLAGSEAITVAFAHNLHKLMAYKDEYEIARLSIDPKAAAAVREQFGVGAKVSYRLHPPILRALGMRRKLILGPWFRIVFVALVAMRRVRGTKLDPFGFAEVRRVERSLITEYGAVIDRALANLTAETLPVALQIAELPDQIRGYEQIKLKSVDRYRQRLAVLESEFSQLTPN